MWKKRAELIMNSSHFPNENLKLYSADQNTEDKKWETQQSALLSLEIQNKSSRHFANFQRRMNFH